MTASEWNDKHPVGTPVLFWPGLRQGSGFQSRTRSAAWEMGDGTPVVKVVSRSGGIALTHVEPLAVTDAEFSKSLVEKATKELRERVERLSAEVEAVLMNIPPQFRVRVREGGGPEETLASLAVSVSKLVDGLARAREVLRG